MLPNAKTIFRFSARILATLLAAFASSPVRADMTLERVIENVRRNETLYDNLDVTMYYEYALAGSQAPSLPNGSIPTATRKTTHYVRQGGMYRLDEEGGSTVDEGQRAENRMRAFDGVLTRLFEQNAIGNIVTGRLDDGMRIEPHILLLRPMLEARVPLSVFLSGTAAVQAHPLNSLPGGAGLESAYLGTTDFNGLHCQRVSIVMTDASGQPTHRHELLLAEERNYLPVSLHSYTYRWSTDLPVADAGVTDLREIAPGAWFPFGARFTKYKSMVLRNRGVQETSWTDTYSCKDVSLSPAYARSYFSEVDFPDGTMMYIIENGAVKTSYVKGAPGAPEEPGSKPVRGYLLWALNVLLVIGALFLVTKRRLVRVSKAR